MIQILERVRTWAGRYPGRTAHAAASAGTTPTRAFSYRELWERTRAVAAYLRRELPGDGLPVIVLGHKEPEMLAGFLGAVGSGHPYIPLDDSLPAQRVETIARTSGARIVLTPAKIAELPAPGEGDPAEGIHERLAADAPFYIIFTSGSTGEPKGVVITAGCLDAFLSWMLSEHALAEAGEVFLNQAPFSFDLSVMDLYLSLATGGTLYSVTRREIADFKALYRAFTDSGLTAWVSTPSFAQLCLVERTFSAERLPDLRRFLFCGETLLPETAGRLLDRFPAAEVWNTYGPTEATVATTSIRVTRDVISRGGPLPVGQPRPGTAIVLLGKGGNPVEGDERGEIVIAGPNVSPGYLGRPELTEKAFFRYEGLQAYRTGDWGRRREGWLFFEGRQDHQIKLNGYRIELADIEAHLSALPGVRDCAVVPIVKAGAVQSLTAFVAADPEAGNAEPDRLRAALAERIPSYMVPRKILVRPYLPMTGNGKVDRRQLAEAAAGPAQP